MNLSQQLAKHFREVHFGGNWTVSNLKDLVKELTWQQATTKIDDLNTIAALVFHMNYYVAAVSKVLAGEPLVAKDDLSFNHPTIKSQLDWQKLIDKALKDAETFAQHLEKLPEAKIWENFTDEKYGIYYRNIHGIIEHTHYHLGQVAIIKKMELQRNEY